MKFTHHPREANWELQNDVVYRQRSTFKPHGLWLSVDDDWRRYCTEEYEQAGSWMIGDEFELHLDLEKILVLSTAEEIYAFGKEYCPPQYEHRGGIEVDWERATSLYKGIMIAPYCWEARLSISATWYYTWDAASVCVWDTSCVTELGLVEVAS